jgi:hypothetical protein
VLRINADGYEFRAVMPDGRLLLSKPIDEPISHKDITIILNLHAGEERN